MRFIIKIFLWSALFAVGLLPAWAKPDVLPILGARYKFYLADPPNEKIFAMNASFYFGQELGQTENDILTNKTPAQQIDAQAQLTKDLKMMVLNTTQKYTNGNPIHDNAIYIFKKNEVIGYLVMEPITSAMKYPERLLNPIRQMNPLPNYLDQILGNTTQAQETGLTVYETRHHGFIERYFLQNDLIAIEGFYPAELESVLRPYLTRYLQAQYLGN